MSNGNILHPDRAVARVSDPETSHEAAASVNLNNAKRIVLEAARLAHETIGEFTDDDLIAVVNGRLTDSSVRSRRCELDRDHGLIEPTGNTRAGRTGRRHRTHRLTALALTQEKQNDPPIL